MGIIGRIIFVVNGYVLLICNFFLFCWVIYLVYIFVVLGVCDVFGIISYKIIKCQWFYFKFFGYL